MKGNNSILPPGANFEGARRGRSNMRMAVVVVVMLHVVLFTGILFQACKQKEDDGGGADEKQSKLSTAEEMAQIVGQQPEVPPLPSTGDASPTGPLPPTPAPTTTEALPPLPPTGGGNALPPLPPNGGASSAAPTPAPTPGPFDVTAPGPVPALGNGQEHVVANGENFWTIGKKYGVSAREIEKANPNVVPTRMKIGQKLTIPAKSAPAPAPPAPPVTAAASGSGQHIVARGENFWTIGKKYGVSARSIEQANPGVVPTKLKIGQKIAIPGQTPTAGTLGPLPTLGGPRVDLTTGLPLPPPPGSPAPLPER